MSILDQFISNRILTERKIFSWSTNVDWNATGAVFSSGMKYPTESGKLEIQLGQGEVVDTFDDFSRLDLGNSSNFWTKVGSLRLSKEIDFGDGRDGSIVIGSNTNFSTAIMAANRTQPDAIAFNLVNLSAEYCTLSTSIPAGALAPGDEILLINLQGISSAFGNVGNYEFLRVKSVSGTRVDFTTRKLRYYGNNLTDDSNIGISTSNQRVIIQRVPNYSNVTINYGITLSCNGYDRTKYGIICFRVSNTFLHNGSITASSAGYSQGNSAAHGEGIGGYGAGTNCSLYTGNDSPATKAYNTTPNDFSKLNFGGGGAGAYYHFYYEANGSSGAGIIAIFCNTLINSGNFIGETGAAGYPGASTAAATGAGGTILIRSKSIEWGTHLLDVRGYINPYYGVYPNGKIGIYYTQRSGGAVYSYSSFFENPVFEYVTSATVKSTDLVNGIAGITSIESMSCDVPYIPFGSSVYIQFSVDGVVWKSANGVVDGHTDLVVGPNVINLLPLNITSGPFFYRVQLASDGNVTAVVDRVVLSYSPKAYTTGIQTWTSNTIDLGYEQKAIKNFTFKWIDDGEAVYPKFQIMGSDTGVFGGEEEVFPAVGQYFEKGTAYDVSSGEKFELSSRSMFAHRYWKVKVQIDAGSDYVNAAKVDSIVLEFEPKYRVSFIEDIHADRPFIIESFASTVAQQFGHTQYLFEDFGTPVNIDWPASTNVSYGRFGVKMVSLVSDARLEFVQSSVSGWDGGNVSRIVGSVFGDAEDLRIEYSTDGGNVWNVLTPLTEMNVSTGNIKLAVVLPTTAKEKVRSLHGIILSYDSAPQLADTSSADAIVAEYLKDRPYIVESYASTLAQRIALSQYFTEDFANDSNIDYANSSNFSYAQYNAQLDSQLSEARLELVDLNPRGIDGSSPITKFYIDLVYDDADFKIFYSTDGGTVWNQFVKGSMVSASATYNLKVAVVLPDYAAIKNRSIHGIVVLYE